MRGLLLRLSRAWLAFRGLPESITVNPRAAYPSHRDASGVVWVHVRIFNELARSCDEIADTASLPDSVAARAFRLYAVSLRRMYETTIDGFKP